QGIPHGPHPGTIEASLQATYTAELAVMCDTFRPLFPTRAALELDDLKYPESWQGEHFPRLASGEIKLNGARGGNGHAGAAGGNGEAVADVWAPGGPAPASASGQRKGRPAASKGKASAAK